MVDHLIKLRNAPPFGGRSEIVIDGTSIGRVVSDMLWDQSVPHSAVQMTGGQEWRRSGRYVNPSKTLMIENLAVLFAAGELKFAHDPATAQRDRRRPCVVHDVDDGSGQPDHHTVAKRL